MSNPINHPGGRHFDTPHKMSNASKKIVDFNGPEFFKQWLLSLSNEQAKEMWDYFDSEPILSLVDKVIDIVALSALETQESGA